jgi:hypothetical protein
MSYVFAYRSTTCQQQSVPVFQLVGGVLLGYMRLDDSGSISYLICVIVFLERTQHILRCKENIQARVHMQTHTQRIQGRKLPHPNYRKALCKKIKLQGSPSEPAILYA